MKKNRNTYKDKIIVALDVNSLASVQRLLDQLEGLIKIFKVGSQLFTACGPEAIRMITRRDKQVFLDLKFHDIPNTVGRAVEAAVALNVFMLNLHITGGLEMMRVAVDAAQRKALSLGVKKPFILGVSVLTSLGETELKQQLGIDRPVSEQVLYLAKEAKQAGLDGIVCSPQEIELVRQHIGEDFLIVTPGIRPSWSEFLDQKRIMVPLEAFTKGADYIVIGRPITASPDPTEATQRILSEL